MDNGGDAPAGQEQLAQGDFFAWVDNLGVSDEGRIHGKIKKVRRLK